MNMISVHVWGQLFPFSLHVQLRPATQAPIHKISLDPSRGHVIEERTLVSCDPGCRMKEVSMDDCVRRLFSSSTVTSDSHSFRIYNSHFNSGFDRHFHAQNG